MSPSPDRRRRVFACALLFVGVACGPPARKLTYSPHELRADVLTRIPAGEKRDFEAPYQVTPELLQRAHDLTVFATSEYDRAQFLLRAITDEKGFGLEYEPVSTTVAIDTVARGHGNCLSLTSLYIGLARGIGLTAYYVDASDRINDLRREQDVIVDSGHIAATVRTERGWSMVDFDGDLSDFRTFNLISDVEALAHFHNNLGYEVLHTAQTDGVEIPWALVSENFELAAWVRPNFTRALNNLGVAYTRLGRLDQAEEQYTAAIDTKASMAAPYHNLANRRLRAGDLESAIELYERAAELQPQNPFLYYHMGLAFLRSGDLDRCVAVLQRAVALKSDFNEPRNVLAQVYRQQGRKKEADRILKAVGQRQLKSS